MTLCCKQDSDSILVTLHCTPTSNCLCAFSLWRVCCKQTDLHCKNIKPFLSIFTMYGFCGERCSKCFDGFCLFPFSPFVLDVCKHAALPYLLDLYLTAYLFYQLLYSTVCCRHPGFLCNLHKIKYQLGKITSTCNGSEYLSALQFSFPASS